MGCAQGSRNALPSILLAHCHGAGEKEKLQDKIHSPEVKAVGKETLVQMSLIVCKRQSNYVIHLQYRTEQIQPLTSRSARIKLVLL